MISEQLFQFIKEKYGRFSSWALWKDPDTKAKSNIDDLSILDPEKNPLLFQTLHTDVVMIGLNFSRPVVDSIPFINFHDSYKSAQDYKIRYAFRNTFFYGAYMTDVIKGYECKESGKLKDQLKKQREIVYQNLENLRGELLDVNHDKPIILAFGEYTFKLLKILDKSCYSSLIPIMHYSNYIGQLKYKEVVLKQIGNRLPAHSSK